MVGVGVGSGLGVGLGVGSGLGLESLALTVSWSSSLATSQDVHPPGRGRCLVGAALVRA